METLFKRCVDSVTASWRNPFLVARIKLTGIYGTILSVIVVGFSVLLYQSISFNIVAIVEDELAGFAARHVFIEHALTEVRAEITFIALVVVIATTIASYFLARFTLKPIEHAMQAQQKFTENASHELRTPLAIMRSEIEVLLRAENPTKAYITETLVSTIEEISSLSTLAEDLLLLAKSERAVFPKTPLALDEVLMRVVTMLDVIAKEKGVMITYDPLTVEIPGNETALTRVFLNLVHNAITHTKEAGVVTLKTTLLEHMVEVRVTDTGVGIPVADQPHIFERFYKGGSSHGTGLGLAIVAELVAIHQGKVWLESSTDTGTTFVVALPRR
jgi:two-component system, OmpR family, sensor histidine kinase CiaH